MIDRKKYALIMVIWLILYIISQCIPYDKWFIRFDTLEDAWKSTKNRDKQIISQNTLDDIIFINYIDEYSFNTHTYVVKDNRGWIPPINRDDHLKLQIASDNFVMTHWYDFNKNIIAVSTDIFENENQPVKVVTDNIDTNFKYVRIKYGNKYFDQWCALIDKVPENYVISVDGKELKWDNMIYSIKEGVNNEIN